MPVKDRFRRPSHATVVAYLALFVALGGTTAYAADTVFSTDIVDGEVKTADLASPAVTTNKLAANSVTTGKVAADTLGADDLAAGSVRSSEVADDSVGGWDIVNGSIWGDDINEGSLDVAAMGCKTGKVNGFARIEGAAGMGSTYGHSRVSMDHSCGYGGSGSAWARRASVGVYYVKFDNNFSTLAVATPNSDNTGTGTAVRDNIVSVAKMPDGTCEDCGAFRVQVEDVSATGTGTVPTDGWFTIMVM
jgi:hypothetical protein